MILRNLTSGNVIADDVEIAESFIRRLWGLRFEKFTSAQSGLILPATKQLDTYFYPEKISVLALDSEKIVLENLVVDPYQITLYLLKSYFYVLLPYENKEVALVQSGHQITWQYGEYLNFDTNPNKLINLKQRDE